MQTLTDIRELLEQERWADALRACEVEIQQRGSGGETALLTAQALVGLARLQEAETWVQRARVDLPDEGRALRLLAHIYRRRGWRVRAQAIERRLSAIPRRDPQDDIPTTPPIHPVAPRPGRAPLAATLDVTMDPSVESAVPPESRRMSSAVEEPPAADQAPPSPDPLGLLTAEEAEAMRTGQQLPVVAPEPPPPRPTMVPRTTEPRPEPAPTTPEPSPEVAPATEEPRPPPPEKRAAPQPARSPRPAVPRPPTPRSASGPQTVPPRPTAAPANTPRSAPRPRRATAEVDLYVRQRRRSKLLFTLGTVLLLASAVAGVVLYRAWRAESRRLALARSEGLIDGGDYDGLREARQLIAEALDATGNPDGQLCAQGAQVELYLWLYYTGDRAYLNQARRLLEDAELRGTGTPETRFTRALWEGYFGDPSRALETARALDDTPGVRPDRPYLLRGIAAAGMGDHALAVRHLEKATSLQPTPLNHLAFAREAERLGARIDAVDQLEAVLDIEPEHMAAGVELALVRAGDPTEEGFLTTVEEVLALHNGKVPPRVMSRVFAAKAVGLYARGEREESAGWFERALEEDRDNPDLLRAYAHELRIRGDLAAARAQLARVETLQPFSGDALGELALIAYLQDRPDLVESRLDDFPEGARNGAAFRLATSLVAFSRGDAESAADGLAGLPLDLWAGEARLLLGDAQLAAGRSTEARESYVAARRELERQRGPGDPLIAVADLSRDLADVQGGKRLRADRVDEVLGRHRRCPIVLFSAARLREAQGDRLGAARLYRRAFERGQEFSLALVAYVRTSGGIASEDPLVDAAAREYLRIAPGGPASSLMTQVTRPPG